MSAPASKRAKTASSSNNNSSIKVSEGVHGSTHAGVSGNVKLNIKSDNVKFSDKEINATYQYSKVF